jgi:DNA-binding CsgD family transcriptional regulator
LASLTAAADVVAAGSGEAVVVAGAAGVGKTRLLQHACQQAAGRGIRVLAGRGSGLEREYAFGLVRQVFEPVLAATGDAGRARLLTGAAAAAGSILGPSAVQDAAPGESAGGLAVLHGLYWLTSNLCQDGPVALVLDDLHWADEASLRFLAYLLPRLDDVDVLLVAGLRPGEAGAGGRGTALHLLDVILTNPACRVLRPAPLSAAASAVLLGEVFGQRVDSGFAAACHDATGGNPLLLVELARAASIEGVQPTAANIGHALRIGSRGVARRVALRVGELAEHRGLVEAIAVLAPGAELSAAARLAGASVAQASKGVAELEAVQLVRSHHRVLPGSVTAEHRYDFSHPLVQAAVYDQIPADRRAAYHARAVAHLSATHAASEQVAAHLLRLPPAGDPQTVAVLRRAAVDAVARGAPEAGLTYLRRALHEPQPEQDRLAMLTDAGIMAARVDLPASAELLHAALDATTDRVARGRIAYVLSLALLSMEQPEDAVHVLVTAIKDLPPEEDDLTRVLEAILLDIATAAGYTQLLQALPRLRKLPPAVGVGAQTLDATIAWTDTYAGDPASLHLARRAVANPAVAAAFTLRHYMALTVGDPEEGIAAFDALIPQVRRAGELNTLAGCYVFRGVGLLNTGDLAEAEDNLREGQQLMDLISLSLGRPLVTSLLAETLIEQGRLSDAETVLRNLESAHPLSRRGPYSYFAVQAWARLLRAQGRYEEALQAALDAGTWFAEHGGQNPAVLAWRSQAAPCLHALHRGEEACKLAAEEVELARRWAAPYALGRALRVAGLVTPGETGVNLLRQAVEVLAPSSARLEHAKALIDLGAALRRANHRSQARQHLVAGLELASHCGATPLVEHAATELRATGTHPHRLTSTGPEALTPSERRVAGLAADGLTNRQIAQELFITVKTVEVHLSAAYRKLGITRRNQLVASHISTEVVHGS